MPNTRPVFRFLLAALFGVAAVVVYVFFGLYLLLGLIAINLVAAMLAPIARKRGWGSEGRLTRHLSRPPFEDRRTGARARTETIVLLHSARPARTRDRGNYVATSRHHCHIGVMFTADRDANVLADAEFVTRVNHEQYRISE